MRWLPFLAAAVASCGTLASTGASDEGLPSSGVGPFRPLLGAELPPFAVAPFVLDDAVGSYREPSVVGAGAAAPPAVLLFAVARVDGRDVIVRTRADDGRAFYGDAADNVSAAHPRHQPEVVLAADATWEGAAAGNLGGPSALIVGGDVWLYYAAAGGIGLARSSGGGPFRKAGGPVLAPDAQAAWETTSPRAPSVAVLPDGSWRMFYGAGSSIGEAQSDDGVAWTRVDGDPSTAALDPVLAPSAAAGAFDAAQVDDPAVALRTTPAGRLQVRVLYTGYALPPGAGAGAGARGSAIGFAARYGEAGALARQAAAVYSVALHEAAPALFEANGTSLLYVHEDEGTLDPARPYPAIACAVAPVGSALPPAAPFPATP